MSTTLTSYAEGITTRAIIPTISPTPTYLSEYYSNYSDIDFEYCQVKYANYLMRFDDADKTDKLIKSLIRRNDYKYTTLWNTLNLDYNPIENYDRNETGTNIDTHTMVGSLTNSSTQTDTPNLTSTSDPYSVNQTSGSYPYDDDTTRHNEKGTTTDTPTITTHQTGTNTTTISGSNGASSDYLVTDNHTTNLRIHGNVGVTTSQQMIESERQVALFTFYDTLFADIVDAICLYTFDEDYIVESSSGGGSSSSTDAYSVTYGSTTVGAQLDVNNTNINALQTTVANHSTRLTSDESNIFANTSAIGGHSIEISSLDDRVTALEEGGGSTPSAENVTFDNSGLEIITGTNVQDALSELDSSLDNTKTRLDVIGTVYTTTFTFTSTKLDSSYPVSLYKIGKLVIFNSQIKITGSVTASTSIADAGTIPSDFVPMTATDVNIFGTTSLLFGTDGSISVSSNSSLSASTRTMSGVYLTA